MGIKAKKVRSNHVQEEVTMAATTKQQQQQEQLNLIERKKEVREMFAIENHGFVVDDKIVNSASAQQPSLVLSSPSSSPSEGEGNGINDKNLKDNLGRISRDDDAEKSLIAKLSGLSIEERTQAIHELHGVADNVEEESSEAIRMKLREMTVVANSFGETNATAAYRMAVKQNSHYVDTKIKLLCLRSTYYDVEKATTRMLSFFSMKRRIFGDDKLTKDIAFDDLNEKDAVCLQSGLWQLAMGKDRASRAIVMLFAQKTAHYGMDTLLRICYYVIMQALRDEDVQKKGIVHIFYSNGKSEFHSDRAKKYADMWLYFPIRIVALHFCYDSAIMDLAARMVEQAMEADHLCRFRRHQGSALEIAFHLMTFGIPKELIPVNTETGEVFLHHHHQMLETWKNREQVLPQAVVSAEESGNDEPRTEKEIAVPGPMDIVIGLGRQSISSTGYLKFRNVLLDHRTEYENSARFEKTMIAGRIYKELQDNGCRFVRSEGGILTEATEVEARDKISHAFRNMRQQGTRRKGRTSGAAKRRASS